MKGTIVHASTIDLLIDIYALTAENALGNDVCPVYRIQAYRGYSPTIIGGRVSDTHPVK